MASNIFSEAYVDKLSSREIEILWLYSKGYKPKEIANILFIQYDTVEYHKKNLFRLLKIHDTNTLIIFSINLFDQYPALIPEGLSDVKQLLRK